MDGITAPCCEKRRKNGEIYDRNEIKNIKTGYER